MLLFLHSLYAGIVIENMAVVVVVVVVVVVFGVVVVVAFSRGY